MKGEHEYDFVGGEVTFFDECKQDYVCQFVIDEFGEELGLQAPYTVFFMNLQINELEMITGDIGVLRMVNFGMRLIGWASFTSKMQHLWLFC